MVSGNLQRIRHLVLDMDGTIYRGSTLFDCTLPFLRQVEELGIGYTFITNNSSRSVNDYVTKLQRLGIPATPQVLYTSTDAVIDYLGKQHPGLRKLWILGTPSMVQQMNEAGYVHCDENPEAVVVGFDTTLDYARLCRTAWWISQDIPYIASHPDFICPTDEPNVLVDCGAICACLQAATGRVPVCVGKPEPEMLAGVCLHHNLRHDQLAVVGDRLYTDMAMARRAGATGVLVLTGEATAEEAAAMETPPDFVLRDVGELGRLLAQTQRA